MMSGKGCHGAKIGMWLLVIGGLNWGIIGVADYNVLEVVLGSIPWLLQLVYILVGVSAVLLAVGCPCKACKSGKKK